MDSDQATLKRTPARDGSVAPLGSERARAWLVAATIALRPRATDWRQTARVMIGAAAAFVLYQWLHLPQGYWTVFTVVIVMQGSVGGTLGASTDRMLGTIAGALIGGVAASAHPTTRVALGAALVLAIGAATLLSSIRPRLKVAPVTAAIMLLSASNGLSPQLTVLYRVAEIALGGVIGVMAAWLVLPAPANSLVASRARAVLVDLATIMQAQASALRAGEASPIDHDTHIAIRQRLASVEAAMTEAQRERSSRLAEHAIPPAVPRTLWRVRNDVVLVGRALALPVPKAAQSALATAEAGLLEDAARLARDAGDALVAARALSREMADAPYAAYQQAFAALRRSGATRDLSFEDVGRVFGLGFALEGLHADLADLADRVDEVAQGHAAAADRRAHPRRAAH